MSEEFTYDYYGCVAMLGIVIHVTSMASGMPAASQHFTARNHLPCITRTGPRGAGAVCNISVGTRPDLLAAATC